ncbi:thiamine ABC transporter substrate-binding protein [Nakamurella deserti]|uniref:thiamine ABC transporter substrate-binding protein n=1 Tax=Nakamurella deserti TaxID=2164074 RepID=UPI000DBE7BBD|nr:thiamine ABC transporter substrate-binding protein [Nakamurella deserti]
MSTRLSRAAATLAAGLLLAACGSGTSTGTSATSTSTPTGTSTTPGSTSTPTGSSTTPDSTTGTTVTLVTHDSFNVDPAVLSDFEAASGVTVSLLSEEALANQLILTKDNPLGDVAYGIDNTFASRAVDEGVFAPYTSPLLDQGSADYAFDAGNSLTAVDFGDVCVNVDHTWFTEKGLAEPVTFDDLLKPEYKDLLVVESPVTSSTGLAFLLGTVGHAGEDGWQQYWTGLKDNGVKVVSDWNSAYYVDFSGSDGKGDRPLVVSYASSPPSEVKEGMTEAPTGTLLDTCFRQVEYVGVLAGAKNPEAAQQVVDWMLSPEFQAGLPESMYVYPVDTATELPADWAKYATVAPSPVTVDPATIAANRDSWLQDWSDLLEG